MKAILIAFEVDHINEYQDLLSMVSTRGKFESSIVLVQRRKVSQEFSWKVMYLQHLNKTDMIQSL